MIKLRVIRNMMLAAALSLLLFAEALHPLFHEHCDSDDCGASLAEASGAPFLTRGDVALDQHKKICPICSSALLKYCGYAQKISIGCDCQNLCPMFSPVFVFVEINLLHSPRAPPGFHG